MILQGLVSFSLGVIFHCMQTFCFCGFIRISCWSVEKNTRVIQQQDTLQKVVVYCARGFILSSQAPVPPCPPNMVPVSVMFRISDPPVNFSMMNTAIWTMTCTKAAAMGAIMFSLTGSGIRAVDPAPLPLPGEQRIKESCATQQWNGHSASHVPFKNVGRFSHFLL